MLPAIVIPPVQPARKVLGYKMAEDNDHIIEGTAHIIADDEIDSREWERLDRQFQTKYQVEQGSPYWYVQPQKVLAWDGESLETMTRWVFA